MDSLLARYRNMTVLVVVLLGQLLLLAYQVKSADDVRLIRVWAVTLVTPIARVIESVRSTVVGFSENYLTLRDIRSEARRMKEDLDRLKLENQFLKAELATADRARALAAFQERTLSRTIAARVIGIGPGSGSHVRFVDRGSTAGVQKGMPVVTADGIVGKVTAAFPLASQILLVTDSTFAAGVIAQKSRVRGTLRGTGYGACRVEGVPTEAKVEVGEWFFTNGDDRVFPKGLPVGQVRAIRHGLQDQELVLDPSGFQHGIEELLIIIEGVHQQIPENPSASPQIYMMPPPPAEATPVPARPASPGEAGSEAPAPVAGAAASPQPLQQHSTEADRLRERYRALSEANGYRLGDGFTGRVPDFTSVHRKPAAPAATPSPPPRP